MKLTKEDLIPKRVNWNDTQDLALLKGYDLQALKLENEKRLYYLLRKNHKEIMRTRSLREIYLHIFWN